MSSEKMEIFGVEFLGPESPVMVSANGEITAMKDDSGKFTSFSIMNASLEGYVGFLSNFEIKILSISNNSGKPMVFDFGKIKLNSIERLFLNLQRTDALKFQGDEIFENLAEITVRDNFPSGLPSDEKLPCLKKIAAEPASESDLSWLQKFTKIVDLIIYRYPEKNLMPLVGLKKLRRLCLVEGAVKSLDGIDELPRLEAIQIISCGKLADVNAILKAKSLEHIMFEKFRKIKNWNFLSQKINLKTIWLEVAEDVGFIRYLPNLIYFKCLKVVGGDVSPIDEMGFSKLPHRSKVFYEPID